METLKSCITFEPREDDGSFERAVEKYIEFYGESPFSKGDDTDERQSDYS